MSHRLLRWHAAIVVACLVLVPRQLLAQVSVTATVGTLGPTPYATVGAAFNAINAGTHRGDVRLTLTSSTNEGTTPATLNSSGAGAASYTSVVIQPGADAVTVTGAPGAGLGVVQLNGADNVIIDGDNPNTSGINRNLTILSQSAIPSVTSIVRIATSTGTTSADNDIIRNLNLTGNTNGGNSVSITSTTAAANTSFGIYAGGRGGATATDAPTGITSPTANPAPAGTTINNLLIQNNSINACGRGVVFNGASTSTSTGVTVRNNTIGAPGTAAPTVPPFTSPTTTVYVKGIWVAGTDAVTVTGNTLRNIFSYVGETTTAIELASQIGAAVDVSGNTVLALANNGAFGSAAKAILVSSGTTSYTIVGNVITNVQAVSTAPGTDAIEATANVTSGVIERNQIATVYNRSPNTIGTYGINLAGGNNVTISNNFVADLKMNMMNGGTFSTTFSLFGIRVAAGAGHKVLHNSVNLTGTLFGSQSSMLMTAALGIVNPSCTGLDVRNNALVNTLSGGTTRIAHVALFLPAGAGGGMNLTLDHNAYFCGADDARQGIGQVGTASGSPFYIVGYFDPTTTTAATNMRSFTSQLSASGTNDSHSLAVVGGAAFVSATDLHIPAGTQSVLESRGAAGTGVTADIDGDVRPGPAGSVNGGAGASDLGADEFDGRPVPHLISDSNPADCNTNVRLIATVPIGGTGSIDFLEGATLLGTEPLVDGTAVLSMNTGVLGSHPLRASYAGDGTYAAGMSAPYTLNVVKKLSETGLEVSPSFIYVNDSVQLTATVLPGGATGSVEFLDGASVIGTRPLVSNVATLTTSFAISGSRVLTARYLGDPCDSASVSLPRSVVVHGHPVLTTSPNPSNCPAKVTVTAQVRAGATGTVEFKDGATSLGSAPIANGTASLSVTSLNPGSHAMTGVYSGDATFPSTTSDPVSQFVQGVTTQTALSVSPNPSPCGQVTLTATVTPSGVTGIVRFRENGVSIGTAPVSGGTAALSYMSAIGGLHSFTATYEAMGCFGQSVSAAQNVSSGTPTSTSIAVSRSIVFVGDPVDLTSTVSPASATGTIEFLDGALVIGTAPLASGQALLTTTFASGGTHGLQARYTGDACDFPSISSSYSQVVRTTPLLTSNPSQISCSVPVTFTAFVPLSATGTVEFRDGGVPKGTSPVSNGQATLTLSNLSVGSHSFVAAYSGDATHTAANSDPYVLSIQGSITTQTTLTVTPGAPCAPITLRATVTPNDAPGVVSFLENGVAFGTATLSSGVATLQYTFAPGNHTVQARYESSGCYSPSTSSPKTASQGLSTNVSLTSDLNPAAIGNKFTMHAHVAPASATGTVRLTDQGGATIGSATLVNGDATFSVTFPTPGTQVLVARYDGDACHAANQSAPFSQSVVSTSSTTSLTSNLNPSTCGSGVQLLAMVTPVASEGTVTFKDGGQVVGTASLVNGSASMTVSPNSIGSHFYVASYGGAPSVAGSTSPPYEQMVAPQWIADASLVSDHTPAVGQSVVLTAFVNPSDSPGDCEFLDGPVSLGYGPIVNGQTSITTSFSRAGRHFLRAIYSGTDCIEGQTSDYLIQMVNPAAAQPAAAAAAGTRVFEFAIDRITPNPVRNVATIDYGVARAAKVRMTVVDIQGRTVASLVNGVERPGAYKVVWDGRRGAARAAAGLYFLRYETPGRTLVKRFVLQ